MTQFVEIILLYLFPATGLDWTDSELRFEATAVQSQFGGNQKAGWSANCLILLLAQVNRNLCLLCLVSLRDLGIKWLFGYSAQNIQRRGGDGQKEKIFNWSAWMSD